MSDSTSEDDMVRGEIQKLLLRINEDMKELKNELFLLNNFVQEGQSLSVTSEFVNEKLKIAAKEAGIDLEDLSINDDTEQSNEDDEDQSPDQCEQDSKESTPNSATIEAATKKITEKLKHTLKK